MIITFAIILLGVILIGLFFIKIGTIKGKIKLFVLALILLFIFASISTIVNNNQIKLNSFEGVSQVTSIYLGWLVNLGNSAFGIGDKVVKLTANVIKGNFTDIK